MVGAREVAANTGDTGEKQLRNLTEEMAIASGVTVPRLYVTNNEEAINAFVAGYQPNEAVLVVTRGALEQLNQEQLQGVIGHEFSHILNGDMRINVRLIAMLSGILLIGHVGQYMLRSLTWRRHSYTGRSSFTGRASSNRRGDVALLVAGLALVIVGYIGLFFERIIKAAVSRQREFLADAAAVQFTRNPEGIGGAFYRPRCVWLVPDGDQPCRGQEPYALRGKCSPRVWRAPRLTPAYPGAPGCYPRDPCRFVLDNYCPISGVNIIARGIVGDVQGEPVVATPLYKKHFSLHDGRCLEDESHLMETYAARLEEDQLKVAPRAPGQDAAA